MTTRKRWALAAKRGIDIVGAATAVVALSPLLAWTALWRPLNGGRLPEAHGAESLRRPKADRRRAGRRDAGGDNLESFAVNGVLYTHELFVATEFMPIGIGTGLYVETIETGARAGTVHVVCLGSTHLSTRTCAHSRPAWGPASSTLRARTAIPAPIGAYMKTRGPAVHYRLTGVKPAAAASTRE